MSKWSVNGVKRTSKGYSSGGSSGSSSGSSSSRKAVDYSSINGGSSGGSSGSSGGNSSGGASSSSTNSGRVPANSYGTGDKYAGGNTFVREDGSTYQVYGDYTSPSGKETYTDSNGNITVLKSSNKDLIGETYYNNGDGTYTSGTEIANSYKPVEEIPPYAAYSYTYRGEDDDIGTDAFSMQVDALRSAMEGDSDALQASYDAARGELDSASAEAKRQAYVNQQRALRTLPQTMAAAGYSGGVTETAAANIMNEYQNALIDVDTSRAQEAARLQADLANGIANSNAQYQIQLANALQAAEQYEMQQQQYAAELAMRQRAAALEEQRYNDEMALRQQELALKRAGNNNSSATAYTPNQILGMVDSGLISEDYGRELLGMPATAAPVQASVTNSNGNGWVAIPGLGRVTMNELENLIDNGTVRARKNANGTITYE